MPRRVLERSSSAVRKMNGISARRGSARNASSTANPSISGIITSQRMRSGGSLRASSRPARLFDRPQGDHDGEPGSGADGARKADFAAVKLYRLLHDRKTQARTGAIFDV